LDLAVGGGYGGADMVGGEAKGGGGDGGDLDEDLFFGRAEGLDQLGAGHGA